jgi:hypothetical protein
MQWMVYKAPPKPAQLREEIDENPRRELRWFFHMIDHLFDVRIRFFLCKCYVMFFRNMEDSSMLPESLQFCLRFIAKITVTVEWKTSNEMSGFSVNERRCDDGVCWFDQYERGPFVCECICNCLNNFRFPSSTKWNTTSFFLLATLAAL